MAEEHPAQVMRRRVAVLEPGNVLRIKGTRADYQKNASAPSRSGNSAKAGCLFKPFIDTSRNCAAQR